MGGRINGRFVVRDRVERTVVVARGPLGRHDLATFEAVLRGAMDAGEPKVVVDLRRAPTVDLPLVAVVLRAERELRAADRELEVLSAGRSSDEFGVAVACV